MNAMELASHKHLQDVLKLVCDNPAVLKRVEGALLVAPATGDKRPRSAVCAQCKEEYDVQENEASQQNEANEEDLPPCIYHSGMFPGDDLRNISVTL